MEPYKQTTKKGKTKWYRVGYFIPNEVDTEIANLSTIRTTGGAPRLLRPPGELCSSTIRCRSRSRGQADSAAAGCGNTGPAANIIANTLALVKLRAGYVEDGYSVHRFAVPPEAAARESMEYSQLSPSW